MILHYIVNTKTNEFLVGNFVSPKACEVFIENNKLEGWKHAQCNIPDPTYRNLKAVLDINNNRIFSQANLQEVPKPIRKGEAIKGKRVVEKVPPQLTNDQREAIRKEIESKKETITAYEKRIELLKKAREDIDEFDVRGLSANEQQINELENQVKNTLKPRIVYLETQLLHFGSRKAIQDATKVEQRQDGDREIPSHATIAPTQGQDFSQIPEVANVESEKAEQEVVDKEPPGEESLEDKIAAKEAALETASPVEKIKINKELRELKSILEAK